MRIATWNLERVSAAEPRARRLREVMRAVAADVWVLTETDERLAPEEGMTGISSTTPERAHRDGERWVTIWARDYQLEALPTIDPIRTVCVRLSRQNGTPLLVYGTVLPWRADRRFRPLVGAEAFCYALAHQAADWAALRSANPDHILCVAGDFNQEATPPCRVGTSKGLRAFSRALDSSGLVCLSRDLSVPMSRHTGGARNTIDHICLTAEFASWAIRLQCWPNDLDGLTDHFGTSVELAERSPALA